MSARTNLTVRSQSAYPEAGPSTKTLENMDVTNGNKLAIEPSLIVVLFNSSGTSKTVTFTYDDDAGEASRTKVVTLAAGELTVVQLEARLTRHAADTAEAGFAWLTANGSAGDVKAQAVRLKKPLNA
jgi:hypothetical protein